jgi:hypothetical protein
MCVMRRLIIAALVALVGATLGAQSSPSRGRWTAPRTAWGAPDLQGIWTSDDARSVPMQRPQQFGERRLLTDEEFAERKRRDDETRGDTRAGAGTFVGEVGTRTVRQTSLVIDPPDGRTPPLTAEAQAKNAATAILRARLPQTWEDRSISDRCITRGILAALPTLYGNGLRIVQNPGYVAISYEMIHETRIVPIDGRPHLPKNLRLYMGDPRGRWDGDTLVIDTTNFSDQTVVGQNQTSELLHVTERLTRISAETVQYEATIDDPRTWTKPWTVTVPLSRQAGYQIFPYECHEGNFALRNILSAARAEERATADAIRKGAAPPEPSVWQGNTGLLPDDPSFGRPQAR